MAQDVTLRHHVMRTAHVKSNDLAVNVDQVHDLMLLLLPDSSLFSNECFLFLQFHLHLLVESFEVIVICDQLHAQSLELVRLVCELVRDARNMLLESQLELLDALSPDRLDVADSANEVYVDNVG